MKTKTIKTMACSVFLICTAILLVKFIKSDLSFLRTEFLQHGKGHAQHFINSFIN